MNPKQPRRFPFRPMLAMLVLGAAAGFLAGITLHRTSAQEGPALPAPEAKRPPEAARADDRLMAESPAAAVVDWQRPYPQYQPVGGVLRQFPDLVPGEPPPQDLYRYGGVGRTSFASVDDVKSFPEFYAMCRDQKPRVMEERQAYLRRRYDFNARVRSDATMTRGKPIAAGPVVRPPDGLSFESLAELAPSEVLKRDLFPEGFRPLSHPLQSIGHQLFPQMWTRQHPEHERFDVEHDIPEAYLPEFPPPLFLVTRPDLGDVSRGREINQANFRELFDGVLTPEQLEGLRLLVTRFPTSWFNQTKHRVTREPVRGTACFDCHVNGHTNGAIELDPGTRPTLARVRLDSPSLRGNYLNEVFSLKRSIRSTDHFAEVEEYFDGDISLQPQVGGRQLDKVSTNRMGDFNSIIDFPPAPKLDRMGRLEPRKATEAELRGEALFHGKARCAGCHPPPHYTDNTLHDLRVEEFYPGRAEGPAKTFSLRGIKDSPPYFHDGRLPTLEDTVEFFNLLFQTHLTSTEKADLTAFLLAL